MPDSKLKMLLGPMASGAAVRADGDAQREVRAQHRKAVAIEMEAFGVMAAAHDAPLPEVKAFVMKSICDGEKSDNYQAYAAYTSASALRSFAEKYLQLD
jgi:nucleoside phosphorylase